MNRKDVKKKVEQDIEDKNGLRRFRKFVENCMDKYIGEAPTDEDGNVETIHYRLDRVEKSNDDLYKEMNKLKGDIATVKGSLAFIGIFLSLIAGLLIFIISHG